RGRHGAGRGARPLGRGGAREEGPAGQGRRGFQHHAERGAASRIRSQAQGRPSISRVLRRRPRRQGGGRGSGPRRGGRARGCRTAPDGPVHGAVHDAGRTAGVRRRSRSGARVPLRVARKVGRTIGGTATMLESVPATLKEWETFYVIVGSSAGALTGLQF